MYITFKVKCNVDRTHLERCEEAPGGWYHGGGCYPAQTQAPLHCHHPHYSAGGCWRLHPPAQLCNVSWRNVSTQTCHHLYTDTLHQQCRLTKYEIVLILNAIAVVSTQFWLEPLNLDK